MKASRPSRRLLVVANETVASETLQFAIRSELEDARTTEVLMVAPALNSRLRHWLSDEDGARNAARRRLAQSLHGLVHLGVHAKGLIGDADPLQAIEDALSVFAADRLIIATHPGRSNWLARDLVGRAAERFPLPITHIVVDPSGATSAAVPTYLAA